MEFSLSLAAGYSTVQQFDDCGTVEDLIVDLWVLSGVLRAGLFNANVAQW